MVVSGKDVHRNAWDSLLICIIGRCCRLSGGIDRLGSRTGLGLLLARSGNGSIAISSSQSIHHGGCHFREVLWPVTLRCATTHTGDQAAAELSQLGQVQSLTPEPVKDKGVLLFGRAACDGRG